MFDEFESEEVVGTVVAGGIERLNPLQTAVASSLVVYPQCCLTSRGLAQIPRVG